MSKSTHLWIVRYRRRSWQYHQAKMFLSKPPADRLVKKLLGKTGDWSEWSHLSPLVSIQLIRRPLGDDELVQKWGPRR